MEYNNAGHTQCQATRPWWIMHGTILSLSVPVQNGDSSPFIITIIAWWFRHTQQMFLSWNSGTSRCHSHCKTTFVHVSTHTSINCMNVCSSIHACRHTHKFTVTKQACCVSSPSPSAMKIYMVVYLHVCLYLNLTGGFPKCLYCWKVFQCCGHSWNINLFLKKN